MIGSLLGKKRDGSVQNPILGLLERFWAEDCDAWPDADAWNENTPTAIEPSRVNAMNSIIAINAKNQFKGKIKQVVPGPVVSEILIDTPAGLISSVITTSSSKELTLQAGVPVLALFKATEVSIVKPPREIDSTSPEFGLKSPDQFRGRVKSITPGPVVSEVEMDVPGGIITSVITTRDLESLELVPGSDVVAIVKSTEVAVARLHDGTTGYSPYLD